MTTRADVDRLNRAGRRVVGFAQSDLQALFARIHDLEPALARDLLVESVPGIVTKYGDVGSAAAAEWYEQIRAAQVSGVYTASLASTASVDEVAKTVRAKAGGLWGEDRSLVLAALSGPVQRFVMQGLRGTVAENVRRDSEKPRWARVPSGAKTCAFCLAMCSRGFAYTRPDAARGFHDDCDCQIVPEWSKSGNPIKGYNPDGMRELYDAAKADARNPELKEILASMRRLYPDMLTDGVSTK